MTKKLQVQEILFPPDLEPIGAVTSSPEHVNRRLGVVIGACQSNGRREEQEDR
jgi:hypothetical protein